jgi:hypothetical protein
MLQSIISGSNETKVVARIKWEVRAKVIATGKFKRTRENIALCDSWGIHV